MACAGLYYRKSFTVEPEIIGQRFWLEFEGIAGITEVWLNKKPIAKHNNPYTGFWVEVTNLLQAGDNEITGLYRQPHQGLTPAGMWAAASTAACGCTWRGLSAPRRTVSALLPPRWTAAALW